MLRQFQFQSVGNVVVSDSIGDTIKLRSNHVPLRSEMNVKTPARKDQVIDNALIALLVLIMLVAVMFVLTQKGVVTRVFSTAMAATAGYVAYSFRKHK